MNTFAQEYHLMLNELLKVVKAFKGYNGSKEHMKMLDDCIEKGKTVIIQRSILSENTVTQTFGLVKEMIIKRQKAKNSIAYLEKCIEEEKRNIVSLELEEGTIKSMLEIASHYEDAFATEETDVDTAWENVIKEVSEKSKQLMEKLDNNQLSYGIHHDQITTAFQMLLEAMEDDSKKQGKE